MAIDAKTSPGFTRSSHSLCWQTALVTRLGVLVLAAAAVGCGSAKKKVDGGGGVGGVGDASEGFGDLLYTGGNGGTNESDGAITPTPDATPRDFPPRPDVTVGALPAPWMKMDIGMNTTPGEAGFSSGTYQILASGTGLASGGMMDGFHFVYQSLSGDGEIIARVVFVEPTHKDAKAGIMIRETTMPDSRMAAIFVLGEDRGRWYRRTNAAGTISSMIVEAATWPNFWLKLTRTGNVFVASTSTDGMTWTDLPMQMITMARDVFIGLVGAAQDDTKVGAFIFDNVKTTARSSSDGGTASDSSGASADMASAD